MHKKHVRFKRDLNRRKRAAQNSVERRVDREGWGKAEIQSEHLPLSKKHSQGKQSACFSAEEEKRLQGGWVRRGRRRSSEKRDIAADGKAKAESFECGSALLDTTKKFRPSAAGSFCTASLQKLKKAKGALLFLRLVLRHCRWLSMRLSKRGSAFPKDPSEQKSGC